MTKLLWHTKSWKHLSSFENPSILLEIPVRRIHRLKLSKTVSSLSIKCVSKTTRQRLKRRMRLGFFVEAWDTVKMPTPIITGQQNRETWKLHLAWTSPLFSFLFKPASGWVYCIDSSPCLSLKVLVVLLDYSQVFALVFTAWETNDSTLTSFHSFALRSKRQHSQFCYA